MKCFLLISSFLALTVHAEPVAWRFSVNVDPITDEKSVIIGGTEENDDPSVQEKAKLFVLFGSDGFRLSAEDFGKIPYKRIEAQMRFDDKPAETVPWGPEESSLFCLRNGKEMMTNFLSAQRVVLRIPLEEYSQRTAVFNLTGFRTAWSNAINQLGFSAADIKKNVEKNTTWEKSDSTAMRFSRDQSWSPGRGATIAMLAISALQDGTAMLTLCPGVYIGAKGTTVKLPIRLDNGEWSKGEFFVANDEGTMLIYVRDATPVIKKMISASILEAKVSPKVGTSFIAEFDLEGLGPLLRTLKPQ